MRSFSYDIQDSRPANSVSNPGNSGFFLPKFGHPSDKMAKHPDSCFASRLLLPLQFRGLRRGKRHHESHQQPVFVIFSDSAVVFTEQIANPIIVTIVRQGTTGNVTLGVKGLPTGAAAIIQSPGSSNTGSIAFSAVIAPAGTYPLTITASDGTVTGSASLSLVIGAVVQVGTTKNGGFEVPCPRRFNRRNGITNSSR